MKKIKKAFNANIKQIKDFFIKGSKDSKLLELIFFSFIFVTVILSIMGICVAMSSNKYQSAVVTTEIKDEEVKELNSGGFLSRDETEEEINNQPSEEETENNNNSNNNENNTPDNSQNNPEKPNNNNTNDNPENPNSNNNNSNTKPNSSTKPNSNSNSNSNNNNSNDKPSSNNNQQSNSNKGDTNTSNNSSSQKPSSSSGNNNQQTSTQPTNIVTISCSSSTKKNLIENNVIYPTTIVEQITARFNADTKAFYQADVTIAMYYLNQTTDDLETLQTLFEKRLGIYAGYFNISNHQVVFSSPTEAYINLKNLDYKTYYAGYGKETETYDSFKYTFETGGYLCKT